MGLAGACMFMPCTLVLLLLSHGAGGINGATAAHRDDGGGGGTDDDMASLLDFKRAITNDPSGAMSSWSWNTTAAAADHFCGWKGVTCDGERRRVAALDLAGHTLSGRISASLGNMSRLASLNLSSNLLSGPLPPQLGSLRELVVLDLGGNSLQGITIS